ncbi:WxcM-like domain-containing protein [Tenacibaculum caenipelagi]|uniref:dTDP-4-dehydrorhamnose 3,5-epimerase-like enzyme n=1 Tax=Tenacibaculum caenipelagi TaxID=1325435 RepID=A0A4R6TB09_9FLAO|nr:WxcM-like domain-containing protein [Tenacibaculum caenipelagi]TDQ24096.1 dTDP-4-dehydrorhamnose 3,5-epimerase-like enzyme [Tenacibaculum caenipelagi]
MNPKIISGSSFKDGRGELNFNNLFKATEIKRIYTIQNVNTSFIRRWQGHKIEQRWFTVVTGSFRIELIRIDDWELPSTNLKREVFEISDKQLDVLYIPSGFISSIQAMEENSKLLVMSDYFLNEIEDNYKYDSNYFKD